MIQAIIINDIPKQDFDAEVERSKNSSDEKFGLPAQETSIHKLKSKLKKHAASKKVKIAYLTGDVNKFLIRLSRKLNTDKNTALIFLDPHGCR